VLEEYELQHSGEPLKSCKISIPRWCFRDLNFPDLPRPRKRLIYEIGLQAMDH
jgi:hypothetical protein